MLLKKCPVEACGALVLIVQVDGRPFAVNPVKSEMVVTETEGAARLVSGYQPHRNTCVDISARPARAARPRAG